MKIYRVVPNGKNNFSSCALLPEEITDIYHLIEERIGNKVWSITNYLLRKETKRYEYTELFIQNEHKYKGPFELEDISSYDGRYWLVNERFKNFAEKENIPFNFYPCFLKRERRYIMTLDSLPKITELHMTYDNNSYGTSKIFRSDILAYTGYQVFTSEMDIVIYVTETIKEKLEKEKFNLKFWEDTVKEIPLDKEKLDKEIPEIEREWDRLNREERKLPERMKKETDIIDEYLKEHPTVQNSEK